MLDLATPRAELAGRILADLGAEVLKIEPPGGAHARRLPPFDDRDPTRSLYWAYVGAGKTSRVIDLDQDAGRGDFLDLVEAADVLIESFDPGTMAHWGLDHPSLSEINPTLVYLSVTPYGQKGPKSSWPATDLTLEAAGGRVAMQGDADRPPLPIGYPQASFLAGVEGAMDVAVALNERALSGRGQHLDLSMQEVMAWSLMGALGAPICVRRDPPGFGDDRSRFQTGVESVAAFQLACADGSVSVVVYPENRQVKGLLSLVTEEAAARDALDPDLDGIDWGCWPELLQEGTITRDQLDRAIDLIRRFTAPRTKHDLIRWAIANKARLGPNFDTADLLADEHFRERDFIIEVDGARQPGPWARLSRTQLRQPHPAPTLGSGGTASWRSRRADARTESTGASRGRAFEGLRVADFSWVAAGPTMTKSLADHGATVVKIESAMRPDLSRILPPHFGGRPGLNRSYWMCLYGTSKLSLACDLSKVDGRELAKRVIDWADVVVESFSPGTMARFGFDYDTLSRERPELIMLSTSLLGQSGPLARFAGYGQQACGLAGFHAITGWPDRAPCGVYAPYTDVIAPKYGVAAVAAAILERRRTGLGQHIDLSQVECSMHLLAPLILDQSVNGRTARARGLDSPYACPHGVYTAAGVERYVAVAVENAEQWHALKGVLALDEFDDPRFDDLAARREVQEEIDAAIARWLRDRDRQEAARTLAEAGVPASVVQRPTEVHADPHLAARGFTQMLTHAELGEVEIYGFPTRFSAKPVMVERAPPCLGEHNDHVLRELLGLDEETIARYVQADALE